MPNRRTIPMKMFLKKWAIRLFFASGWGLFLFLLLWKLLPLPVQENMKTAHMENAQETENVTKTTETSEGNDDPSKIWLGQAFWMRGHIMKDILPKPSDRDSFPIDCLISCGGPDWANRVTDLRHEEYGAILQVDAYLHLDEKNDSFEIELRYQNLGNNPFHTYWDLSTHASQEPNVVMILTDGIFHTGKDSKIQDGILVAENWYTLREQHELDMKAITSVAPYREIFKPSNELDANGITTADNHISVTNWDGKKYREFGPAIPCQTPVSPDAFREKIQEYGLCIIGYEKMYDDLNIANPSEPPSGLCLHIRAPEFKISRIKNWENLVLCIYAYPTYLTFQAFGNVGDRSPDAIHICVPNFDDFLKERAKR